MKGIQKVFSLIEDKKMLLLKDVDGRGLIGFAVAAIVGAGIGLLYFV